MFSSIVCLPFTERSGADFVPDHGADGAIVDRGGSLRIKERRLQDSGGKVERVLKR